MRSTKGRLFRYLAPAGAIFGAVFGWSLPSDAAVRQLVIDSTSTATYTPIGGIATSYTIYSGRIFGELNPHDPHNSLITDINLAPTSNGKVDYIANFEIVTPSNPAQRNGLMIYEVPNRGGSAISTTSLLPGVTYVESGWQGDLLTQCTPAPVPLYPCTNLSSGPYGTPRTQNGTINTQPNGPQTAFVIQVPVATKDGKPLNPWQQYHHRRSIRPHQNKYDGKHRAAGYLQFSVGAIPTSRLQSLEPSRNTEHVGRAILEFNVADDCGRRWPEDADYQLDLGQLSERAARHSESILYLFGQRDF